MLAGADCRTKSSCPQNKRTSGCRCWPGRGLIDGQLTAYVCRNYTCQQPVTTPDELAPQLTCFG